MRILLIEDHIDLARNICDYLSGLGHQVDFAEDGQLGLKLAVSESFDVIILDINLPKIDGYSVAQQLRDDFKINTSIIMLTARGTLADKVKGFQAGALDYLVKPFALVELKMRIEALTHKTSQSEPIYLEVGDLKMNCKTLEVTRDGVDLKLHKASIQVLEMLMRASPGIVSRRDLEYLLWGDIPPQSNPLRSHIHEIRKVIDRPFNFQMLKTVKGVGFKVITKDINEN